MSRPCALFDAAGNSVLIILADRYAPPPLSKDFVIRAVEYLQPYRTDIVAILRSDSPWSAEFANPDGSMEMVCGNALRSIPAALIFFKKAMAPISTVVHTAFGTMCVSGTIDSGIVAFPLNKVRVNGRIDTEDGALVDIGTPHRVRLVNHLVSNAVEAEGRAFSTNQDPVNATFVSLTQTGMHLRTFERGVGETRSCGTGAMAAVLALWHSRIPSSLPSPGVSIAFLSGEMLTVVLSESENRISVSGRLARLNHGLIALPEGEVTWLPS